MHVGSQSGRMPDLQSGSRRRTAAGMLLAALALLASLTPPARAASQAALGQVAALVQSGATGLALHLVNRDQPSPSHGAWMAWEKVRYAAYAERHDWDAIRQRACALPAGIPDDFVQWALTRAAQAQLSAHDGAGARFFLRRLLWRERATPQKLARWRRMVIRSYLVDDRLADAETAVAAYEQDFRIDSDSWSVLHGTILLRLDRYRSAVAALAGVRTYEGRLLLLLAGLRSGAYEPQKVLMRALEIVRVTAKRPALHRQAWILADYAAADAKNHAQELSALEHALGFPRATDASDPLFRADADDLWNSYLQVARSIGNRSRLLVGDDRAWVAKASALEKRYPPYARALYAFLSIHGGSAKLRTQAAKRLAGSLFADHDGRAVRALFTASSRFGSLASVPDAIRYRMVDDAIADGDIGFAARLMRSLRHPPPGEKAADWTLRRARVLIYAGDFQHGLALLGGLLDAKKPPDDQFVRRYLQVIFELQTAGANRSAGLLLKTMFPLVSDPVIRRQILFWMADSEKARGRYRRAAELYLRSASYGGATPDDMWGQTARYNAAYALAKAGLTADARSVYRHLLDSTRNPARRAAIERRLQQLWLLDAKASAK